MKHSSFYTHEQSLGDSWSGGNGRYGFNSYNLMTFIVLAFNAVSNAISNMNNNDNNNNNNNNKNDIGSVSGTAQV